MDTPFIIYGLVDPRDGQLRYIGKSTSGLLRARDHGTLWCLKADGPTHKANWIVQLRREGFSYQVVILQVLDDAEILSQAEAHWISYFRSIGCKLTNATSGGEGRVGPCTWGAKISVANKGKIRSLQSRVKQSESSSVKRRIVDNHGTKYSSIREASRMLGISYCTISNVLNGRGKTAAGRTFRYLE